MCPPCFNHTGNRPQSGHKPGSASCTKGQCRHAVTALAETVLQHTLSQKKMNILHMSEWRFGRHGSGPAARLLVPRCCFVLSFRDVSAVLPASSPVSVYPPHCMCSWPPSLVPHNEALPQHCCSSCDDYTCGHTATRSRWCHTSQPHDRTNGAWGPAR